VALRRVRLISLSDVLSAVPPEQGEAGIRRAYEAYRAYRSGENTASDAISFGFQLLSSGRLAEGMALFEMNGATFPEDPTSQFNLGEAYRFTGRPEEAARQYRRTLILDPDHPLARARLGLVTGGMGEGVE
jgi:tetratricopeptide (TPR) repeat protein